jgi:hypothetical protein
MMAISAPLGRCINPLSDPDAPADTPPCGLEGVPSIGGDDPAAPGGRSDPMPAPLLPSVGTADFEGKVDVITAEPDALGLLDCAMMERGARNARHKVRSVAFLTIVAVGSAEGRI